MLDKLKNIEFANGQKFEELSEIDQKLAGFIFNLGAIYARSEEVEQRAMEFAQFVNYSPKTTYKTLRRLLKQKNIKLGQVAERLEISPQTLSKWLDNGEWQHKATLKILEMLELDYMFLPWIFPKDKYTKDTTKERYIKECLRTMASG